jgi:DNA polymerase II large subunit
MDRVGERETAFPILKGVQGLTSSNETPEAMEKGVLRAKHGVTAFKDGTVRYDMTDLPVTAVRAEELDVTADDLRALGYEEDVDGDPLRHDDQLVELKVQDVVLSAGAAEHMLKTADFVDDLLASLYDLPPFYEVDERDDLVGELVFGMAPHTSAAVVGRVVGFTEAAVGYAHPYFHAAKRRNCFHPGTKLWFRDEDGSWRHDRIDAFVEDRLDPGTAREDGVGTLVSDLDGDVFVPSVTEDGEQTVKPVEAVSRHPAPDHLVRVETRSGRELTVTPDHEVHVLDAGEVVARRASTLTEDDHLVTPAHLDAVDPGDETPTLDLLAEFLDAGVDPDRLMVRGIDRERLYERFEAVLAEDRDGRFHPLQSTADHLGLTKKRLSNYLYRESVPVSLLREFFADDEALRAFVPDDARLGMRRDATGIDRLVEVDEDVATLLGYYAAEGFARAQETSKGFLHQTTLCGTEDEARTFFLDTLRDAFGVDPYEESHAKVTASGRLLRTLFDTVLDAGTRADEKRVPQPVFDAPDEVVAAYLRGYFSGDGSVDQNAPTVSATTVSRELKEDLLALLSRLGFEARVSVVAPRPLQERFPEFYDEDSDETSKPAFTLSMSADNAVRFVRRVGFHLSRKQSTLERVTASRTDGGDLPRCFGERSGDTLVDPVSEVEYVGADTDHTYCLTVADTHSLITNDMYVSQCDGDEDCVMLLLDGLLNFSKEFLPDKRGGQMDAPLVMSSRIDPAEIDDEAHNVDVVREYPREFYEATRETADPTEVDVRIAESTLGTDDQYRGFDHTHDTTDIHMGPALSAYKTLGSMTEKTDAQLGLARRVRAVDESDVAERIIEYHFLPDLIGNLRAFSSQETRCLDCGKKYRRMPLTGDCRDCGGRVNLTVHQGSVTKYLDTAIRVAERYDCREYTKQRLQILERSIDRVFEDDTNKQGSIADFM